MEIVTIETPEMGNRSYLVHDGRRALVVDPQRDLERYLLAAAERRVRITHVVETHLHNDYLSGGLALARSTGARYGVSGHEPVAFATERVALADGIRSRWVTWSSGCLRRPDMHHTTSPMWWGIRIQPGRQRSPSFPAGPFCSARRGGPTSAGTGSTDRLAATTSTIGQESRRAGLAER